MGNMSYCRFENTLSDLEDCFNSMSDYSSKEEWLDSLSDEERRAAKKLLIKHFFKIENVIDVTSIIPRYVICVRLKQTQIN